MHTFGIAEHESKIPGAIAVYRWDVCSYYTDIALKIVRYTSYALLRTLAASETVPNRNVECLMSN
jgi:hypothetical protein